MKYAFRSRSLWKNTLIPSAVQAILTFQNKKLNFLIFNFRPCENREMESWHFQIFYLSKSNPSYSGPYLPCNFICPAPISAIFATVRNPHNTQGRCYLERRYFNFLNQKNAQRTSKYTPKKYLKIYKKTTQKNTTENSELQNCIYK